MAAKPKRRRRAATAPARSAARRRRATPAAHQARRTLRRQRHDAEACRARSSASAVPAQSKASSSAAPTSATAPMVEHRVAVVRADQRVPFPQHADGRDRPEHHEAPARRNRPPPSRAAPAPARTPPAARDCCGRPGGERRRRSAWPDRRRPRSRSGLRDQGRRTGVRAGDIRRSRLRARRDRSPASRSARTPVRCRPPARAGNWTAAARRWCG